MNLDKLDIALCLAFQCGEGPFNVVICKINGDVEESFLLREEIKALSMSEDIQTISLCKRIYRRRWRPRSNSGRRKTDKETDWTKWPTK